MTKRSEPVCEVPVDEAMRSNQIRLPDGVSFKMTVYRTSDRRLGAVGLSMGEAAATMVARGRIRPGYRFAIVHQGKAYTFEAGHYGSAIFVSEADIGSN